MIGEIFIIAIVSVLFLKKEDAIAILKFMKKAKNIFDDARHEVLEVTNCIISDIDAAVVDSKVRIDGADFIKGEDGNYYKSYDVKNLGKLDME